MNPCVVCLCSNKVVVRSAEGAMVSLPLPPEWLESSNKACMALCSEQIKAALSRAGFDAKTQRAVCTLLPQEAVRETTPESRRSRPQPKSKRWLRSFCSESETGQTYRFECYKPQIRRLRKLLQKAGIANPGFTSRALAASANVTDEPCAVVYPETTSLIKVVLAHHRSPKALYVLPKSHMDSLNDVLLKAEKHIGAAISVGVCDYVDETSFKEQVSAALAGCGRNIVVLSTPDDTPPRAVIGFKPRLKPSYLLPIAILVAQLLGLVRTHAKAQAPVDDLFIPRPALHTVTKRTAKLFYRGVAGSGFVERPADSPKTVRLSWDDEPPIKEGVSQQ